MRTFKAKVVEKIKTDTLFSTDFLRKLCTCEIQRKNKLKPDRLQMTTKYNAEQMPDHRHTLRILNIVTSPQQFASMLCYMYIACLVKHDQVAALCLML